MLFYAVSVFMSFLAGLLAMARFSSDDRRPRGSADAVADAERD